MALFTIGFLTASRCGSVLSDPLRMTIYRSKSSATLSRSRPQPGKHGNQHAGQGVENPFEEKKCLIVAVAEEGINSGDKKRITR